MSYTQPKLERICWLTLIACFVVVAPGCGKGDEAPPTQTNPDEAMAAWRTMFDTPSDRTEDPDFKLLTIQIAQTAPQHVDEMIGRLEDPSLSNEKRVVLVSSLEEVVSPGSVPRLVEISGSGDVGAARLAATHLLGIVSSDDAKAALRELKNDDAETVRLTALIGLTKHGDESVREDLWTIYRRDDVLVGTRERIVRALSDTPVDGDRAILEDAIQADGFDQNTYLMAVSAIGRVGTLESLGALNALKADPDCSVGVREMCDNTIAAIKERFETAAVNPS